MTLPMPYSMFDQLLSRKVDAIGTGLSHSALDWDQICAWRLERQFLSEPAASGDMLEVVSRLCGVQAQVMSSAELAIGVRTQGVTPAAVQAALWEERVLVKGWVMRGTLHLFTAQDFPLYVAA